MRAGKHSRIKTPATAILPRQRTYQKRSVWRLEGRYSFYIGDLFMTYLKYQLQTSLISYHIDLSHSFRAVICAQYVCTCMFDF